MMRRLASAALAACIAVGACASEEVHHVRIKFVEGRLGFQRGLWCKEAGSNRLLLARLIESGRAGSIVIDYLKLDGIPTCRPAQLQDWCESKGCPPLMKDRSCIPVPVGFADGGKPGLNTVNKLLGELSGQLVSRSAPDEYVLVRAVVTTESCDALMNNASFDPKRLVGCAHSCPALLSDFDGDVLLDLDVKNDNCEDSVDDCAKLNEADVSGGAP